MMGFIKPKSLKRKNKAHPMYLQESSGSGGCDTQDLQIGAEQVLEDAIVTNTENDGNYPNNECQHWNIIADENQVCGVTHSKQQ